ncbi:MAG: glycosyltransferase family 4 protein [Bacteroidetes bacterium]|nr:glycosyltransferase family 4 protein [Bacteroidota bacterium]
MTLRIAYLTHYPELYGANRSLLDLLRELQRRGEVEPFVVIPRNGPLVDALEATGIPCEVVPFQPWMSQRHYSGRIHHRLQQHLVHERASRARRQANAVLLPALVRWTKEHHIDMLHANSAVVGIAPALKTATGLPLIWHIRELPERQYLLHLDAGRSGYARALREADQVIAISHAVADDIATYARLPRPARVIYNGVLPRARYAELRAVSGARWTSTRPFVFALIGLIHPGKGQEEALHALAAVRRTHPHVRLVIAGDGNDAAVQRTIRERDLAASVDVMGFVPDVWPILARSHALLMCSRNEAMGRVTVEAMASGLPVIGHASGGTLELVEDGLNGLRYPGGTEALAERMVRLIDDPPFARQLGDTASRTAEQRFSIEQYADQVSEVYRSVLSGPSRS